MLQEECTQTRAPPEGCAGQAKAKCFLIKAKSGRTYALTANAQKEWHVEVCYEEEPSNKTVGN